MGGSKIARARSGHRRATVLKQDAAAHALVSGVARARRVAIAAILGCNRGSADIALARQVSIYLLRVVLGRSFENISELFWRSRSTAQHACQVVEQLREDDPLLDDQIEKIENAWRKGEDMRHAA
jgi:chromosomal replication initiation ATPase DnaA